MRILVGCEESQAVTIELRNLGYEAFSCDILPCSGGRPEWHIKEDVLKVIDRGWDMLIAFPPCTHLALSGSQHWPQKQKDGRQKKAIDFFMSLVKAPIEKICIENPMSIMSTAYRKPDQIIQPWQYGHEAQKTTCLWLKNLNKLEPTNIVSKGEFIEFVTKKGVKKRQPKWYFDALKNSKTKEDRTILRSKTFKGIAEAMANQFTQPLKQYKLL
jgi:site-specific DNA-cytosine methylase